MTIRTKSDPDLLARIKAKRAQNKHDPDPTNWGEYLVARRAAKRAKEDAQHVFDEAGKRLTDCNARFAAIEAWADKTGACSRMSPQGSRLSRFAQTDNHKPSHGPSPCGEISLGPAQACVLTAPPATCADNSAAATSICTLSYRLARNYRCA